MPPYRAANYAVLEVGVRYSVVRAFTDHDGVTHPVGETWEYLGFNFIPYHDGLSLFVLPDGEPERPISMWCAPEGQGPIVGDLGSYVRALGPSNRKEVMSTPKEPGRRAAPVAADRTPAGTSRIWRTVDLVLRALAVLTAIVLVPITLFSAAFMSDPGTDAAKHFAKSFLMAGFAVSVLILLAAVIPGVLEKLVPGSARTKKIVVRSICYVPAVAFVVLRVLLALSLPS